jgi:hypothetical protein
VHHRQLHVWVTEGEYRLLRELATERHETVSAIIRRLIRVYRLLAPPAGRPGSEITQSTVEAGPRVFG